MPSRQSWVNLGLGCVLCGVGHSLPPRAGAAHLTSAPQVQLCNGHECPGNVVKHRVTFTEAHSSTAPGSVLGPRVGTGGHMAPRGSPAAGTWLGHNGVAYCGMGVPETGGREPGQ